jgi:hypothetical protein
MALAWRWTFQLEWLAVAADSWVLFDVRMLTESSAADSIDRARCTLPSHIDEFVPSISRLSTNHFTTKLLINSTFSLLSGLCSSSHTKIWELQRTDPTIRHCGIAQKLPGSNSVATFMFIILMSTLLSASTLAKKSLVSKLKRTTNRNGIRPDRLPLTDTSATLRLNLSKK